MLAIELRTLPKSRLAILKNKRLQKHRVVWVAKRLNVLRDARLMLIFLILSSCSRKKNSGRLLTRLRKRIIYPQYVVGFAPRKANAKNYVYWGKNLSQSQ